MPATTGQLAFHARVAANALAIVARELQLDQGLAAGGDAAARGSAARGSAGRDLADQVAARLAVANPRYFGDS
jgi:hypothetical protein